jgi:uncharacterized protein (TIGR03086 family)
VTDVSEAGERYATVADGFTARVLGVAPRQWSAPTPCRDWKVRDLVAHVIGTHRAVLARLGEAEPVETDPNRDLPEQWKIATFEVTTALGDKDRASKVIGGMFGEQSFETLVGRLVCTDLLVHTWGLARATGQDEKLDSGAIAASRGFLVTIDDAIRAPGGYSAKIEPSPEADDQTRFLNFCGRAV